jgi:hypothetical protein
LPLGGAGSTFGTLVFLRVRLICSPQGLEITM